MKQKQTRHLSPMAVLIQKGLHSSKLRKTALYMVLLGGSLSLAPPGHAEETVGEKLGSGLRQQKSRTKRGGRNLKKNIRDATGNSSIKEDIKDGAKNVKDSASDGVNNVKDKMD